MARPIRASSRISKPLVLFGCSGRRHTRCISDWSSDVCSSDLMDRVVTVGGGVLGIMRAAAARGLGHDVVHLEREPDSPGASVPNFRLIWVSGRAPGAEHALAVRARARWEELAAAVPGAGFRANGR